MALTQVTSIGLKDGEIVNADLHSAAAIVLSKLNTTGTASSSTFLRGDGAWTAISADGGNAATLDGLDSVEFLRSNTADNMSAKLTLNQDNDNEKLVLAGTGDPYIRFQESTTNKAYIQWNSAGYLDIKNQEDSSRIRIKDAIDFSPDSSNFYTIWHAGNDGSGSGLDADTCDGQHLSTGSSPTFQNIYANDWFRNNASSEGLYNTATDSHFYSAGNNYWHINGNSGDISNGGLLFYSQYNSTHGSATGRQGYVYWDSNGFGLLHSGGNWIIRGNSSNTDLYGNLRHGGSNTVWHQGNDGSGSGLDADTLDGTQAAKFLSSYDRTTTTGWEDSNANFRINGGASGSVGLAMHTSNGTFGYQLYGSGGSTYGFLNGNWAGWDLKKTIDGQLQLRIGGTDYTVWNQQNDGGGSGLDADTVDGYEGSRLLINNTANTLSGGRWDVNHNNGGDWGMRFNNSAGTNCYMYFCHATHGFHMRNDSAGSNYLLDVYPNGGNRFQVRGSDGLVTSNGNKYCHVGNDGSGSGLDADTVDGVEASGFVKNNNNSGHIVKFGSGSNTGHSRSSHAYAIFQEGGAWSSPYPDLCISHHTGIKIGCGSQSYGGLRFTPDYNSETILMSINNGTETNGNGNVKVNTKLYVSDILDCSTTVRCDDWYYNDTGGEGLYSSANGMHWYADATTALNAAGGTSANWIRFRDESAGTVRGYVGANSSNLTGFLDHNGNWRFYITSSYCASVNNFIPNSDNTYDCGLSNARWDDIYATNGTIQTSDRNEKENIVATDLGLAFVNKLSPKSFKRKGKNRTHYGFIAQDIEQIITDLGKTTTQFAPLIKSDVSEEKDGSKYSYGLRYDELLAPIVKAIQELAVKVAALESA